MKTLRPLFIVLTIVAVCFSCGKKPKGEAVEASEAKAFVEEEGPMLMIDTANSSVSWIGYKRTGKHNGTFNIKSGSFSFSNDGITSGKVEIDMASIAVLDIPADDEKNAKLKGHLSSPDFFDVGQYPVSAFEITDVKAFDGTLPQDKEEYASDYTPKAASINVVEAPTHIITGNLTIKGVSKSISFPAKVVLEEGKYKASAAFNIDRTDWGIAYGDENSVVDKAKDKFVYNTVNVGFELISE